MAPSCLQAVLLLGFHLSGGQAFMTTGAGVLTAVSWLGRQQGQASTTPADLMCSVLSTIRRRSLPHGTCPLGLTGAVERSYLSMEVVWVVRTHPKVCVLLSRTKTDMFRFLCPHKPTTRWQPGHDGHKGLFDAALVHRKHAQHCILPKMPPKLLDHSLMRVGCF